MNCVTPDHIAQLWMKMAHIWQRPRMLWNSCCICSWSKFPKKFAFTFVISVVTLGSGLRGESWSQVTELQLDMIRSILFATTTAYWVIISSIQVLVIINIIFGRSGLLLLIRSSRSLAVSWAPIGYPYCFLLTLNVNGFISVPVGSSWLESITTPSSCHRVWLLLQTLFSFKVSDDLYSVWSEICLFFFFHFLAPSVLVEDSYSPHHHYHHYTSHYTGIWVQWWPRVGSTVCVMGKSWWRWRLCECCQTLREAVGGSHSCFPGSTFLALLLSPSGICDPPMLSAYLLQESEEGKGSQTDGKEWGGCIIRSDEKFLMSTDRTTHVQAALISTTLCSR